MAAVIDAETTYWLMYLVIGLLLLGSPKENARASAQVVWGVVMVAAIAASVYLTVVDMKRPACTLLPTVERVP